MKIARLNSFWFWEPGIEDDRSQWREIPRQDRISDAPDIPDWLLSVHGSYRRRLASRSYAVFWNLLLAIPVGIGATAIWVGPSPQVVSPNAVLVMLGLFLLGSQGLRVGMRAMWRAQYRAGLRHLAVRFGVCGLCGWQDARWPSDPDGCTVCPECGAAWKIQQKEPATS